MPEARLLQHIKTIAPKTIWGLMVFLLCLSSWFGFASPNHNLILQLAQQRYGANAVKTVTAWQSLIRTSASIVERDKLTEINRFFNRHIRFQNDQQIWKKSDYWATPLETMGRAQGDCEDFSIAKYVSLLLAGVPLKKLRLVYVKARIGKPSLGLTQAHMVLAYYPTPNAMPLILDNLNPQILPASKRRDLIPIFSFNGAGLWIQGKTKSVGSAEKRLSRWRNVLLRLQAEGFNYADG